MHPVGVARICAGMRLDTETLCAALLHDTVEDTSASIEEVRARFGEEIAAVVDGVTKLTGITFQSRDEAQAENYRKMMVAMATDVRVILIKLADRLHNMRTIEAMPKQKQNDKARRRWRSTRRSPTAWGSTRSSGSSRTSRSRRCTRASTRRSRAWSASSVRNASASSPRPASILLRELAGLGIEAQIAGRAKHFYSIYSKMTKKGREFNEIFDLTAMRVIVDSVKDCYGAVGVSTRCGSRSPGASRT